MKFNAQISGTLYQVQNADTEGLKKWLNDSLPNVNHQVNWEQIESLTDGKKFSMLIPPYHLVVTKSK